METSTIPENNQPLIRNESVAVEETKQSINENQPVFVQSQSTRVLPTVPLNGILQTELFTRFERHKAKLEHYDADKEERKQKLKIANKPSVSLIPSKLFFVVFIYLV